MSSSAAVTTSLPAWFTTTLISVEQWLSEAPHPMSARLARLHDRFSHGNGATSIGGTMSAASATPIFAMLEALRVDYEISIDDPRFRKITEASLFHYLYLRLQDDLVDEPEQFDRAFVYVLQSMYDEGLHAFMTAFCTAPEFFDFQRSIMSKFANTAIWEVDVVRNGISTRSDTTRLGEKFLPLSIPLGAMAFLAKRQSDAKELTEFTIHLGTGLQIINDILNIQEDHRSKRFTPVLNELYKGQAISPGEPSNEIRLLLINDKCMKDALMNAELSIKTAVDICHKLQTKQLASIVQQRLEFIKSIPFRLLTLHMGVNEL